MRTIKYIGFYNPIVNKTENRNTLLSATNKMDYIASKLNQLEGNVEIISPSWTYNNRFYNGKTIEIGKNISVRLSPTLPWNKICKYISILFCELWLFLYLLFNTGKNESVIVYHSLLLMYPLYFAKKFKRFELILEVEEIYQDVKKYSKIISKMEYRIFEIAERYIFSTEMLNLKLNQKSKPYSVIYGTYQVEEERGVRFDDGKIHVVYAGTFEPRKGGALAAATAAKFLSEKYHIHIIGFGTEEQIEKLQDTVNNINNKSKATVSYDGLLKGEDYVLFLQKCHIGLSTQNPDAKYNDTSFPSKILSYMANGLRVVTVRIKAVETSAIGEWVYYYNEQTPKDIAETIMSIDLNEPYDSRKIIKKLDEKLVKEIKALLKA